MLNQPNLTRPTAESRNKQTGENPFPLPYHPLAIIERTLVECDAVAFQGVDSVTMTRLEADTVGIFPEVVRSMLKWDTLYTSEHCKTVADFAPR